LSASAELLVFESVLMLYAKIIKSVLVKTILFYLVAGKKPVALNKKKKRKNTQKLKQ